VSKPSSRIKQLVFGVVLGALLVVPVVVLRAKIPAPVSAEASYRVRGEGKPVITIIEYSDFECPACRNVQPALKALLEKHPGQVRLEFKHYPLKSHKWSPLAHQSAECAGTLGSFWTYHDRLYAEQPIWKEAPNPPEFFIRYAVDMGIDPETFVACLQDESITARIMSDRRSGDQVKISSTPTFFVDGVMYVGGKQFTDEAIPAIEEKLA